MTLTPRRFEMTPFSTSHAFRQTKLSLWMFSSSSNILRFIIWFIMCPILLQDHSTPFVEKHIFLGMDQQSLLQVFGDWFFHVLLLSHYLIACIKNVLYLCFEVDTISFVVQPDGKELNWAVSNTHSQDPLSPFWLVHIFSSLKS